MRHYTVLRTTQQLRPSYRGLTTAFIGAKPASEAPLVERPVQGMVGLQ
jgi:hypothetical protein